MILALDTISVHLDQPATCPPGFDKPFHAESQLNVPGKYLTVPLDIQQLDTIYSMCTMLNIDSWCEFWLHFLNWIIKDDARHWLSRTWPTIHEHYDEF